MQITTNQLVASLRRNLPKILVVYGEETLLQIEACQQIKRIAHERGYKDQKLLYADQTFDWNELDLAISNLSLFATKQIIDIRIPTGKPGAAGAKALQKLGDSDLTDMIVLVSLSSFDRQIKNSKWFQSLDKSSLMIYAQKISKYEFPRWVAQKLSHQNQQADRETIDFIIERVEGNLLAASQEIEKLGLVLPAGSLSLELVDQALRDVSRYDISDIGTSILTKDRRKFVKVARSLEFEGAGPPLVLWAITQEIRTILTVMIKLKKGITMNEALRTSRCWGLRKQTIPYLAKSISRSEIIPIIKNCHKNDLIIKGLSKSDPWDSLINLGLTIIDTFDKEPLSGAV